VGCFNFEREKVLIFKLLEGQSQHKVIMMQ
jgi:hypothetical protein